MFMEEMPINGSGSTHFLSHDRDYFIHEMVGNSKRFNTFVSGGLLNSMAESIEDIQENTKQFNKPIIVFMAGRDKVIKNNFTKKFLKKCGTP